MSFAIKLLKNLLCGCRLLSLLWAAFVRYQSGACPQLADTLTIDGFPMRLSDYQLKYAASRLCGAVLLVLSPAIAPEAVVAQDAVNDARGDVDEKQTSGKSADNGVRSAQEPDLVAYWISQLSHEHYLRREKASQKLKELGPGVIPALTSAMNTGDLEVIERSVAVISNFASSLAPGDDGNAWETLNEIASNSVGRRALAAKSAMKEVSEERCVQAKSVLAAAGVFVGEGEFSIAAAQRLRSFIEVGDKWNGDPKSLSWLKWVTEVEHVLVTGNAIRGSVLRNVVKMPDLKGVAIADSKPGVAVEDEVFSSLSEMQRIESLDIRYVAVSERQSDIISRLPLRGSLTLMGTGIKSEVVDRIRNRLAGLEIQYRMGGFLGVSCYADDQECKVSTVHAGTAAFEAGLVFHDVIVGAGDDEVTSFSTLQKAINQHVAGEEIEIRFLRGKKLMKAKVRLGRLKDN